MCYTKTAVIYSHYTVITKVMLLYKTELWYDHEMALNYCGKKFYNIEPCGPYYKLVMIVNDASSSVNKLKASLIDAARGVIYDHHMFMVQATGGRNCQLIYPN